MSRTARRALAAVVLALLGVLLLPSVASAHAVLLDSSPAANSVLVTAPKGISLHYDEPINASLASIRLFDGKGKAIPLDTPHTGTASSYVDVAVPPLGDGLYAVVWRVTSVDGHVVDGAFSFQIGSASTGSGQSLIAQVSTGAALDASVTWTYGIGRFLAMAGLVLLVGVGGWSLQGRPELGAFARFGRLRPIAWVIFTVGSLLCLAMFAAEVRGGSFGDAFSGKALSDALRTDTGRMLLARVASALLFLFALLQWRARSTMWWRVIAGVSSLVAIVSFSASGHPNALSPRVLWIALDVAHLGAVVVWLGGLVALGLAPKAWLAEPEAVRPTHRFSFAATVAVPVIVGTGSLATWKLAGGLHDITATTWGRVLVTKVLLVVVMLAFAGVSRWLLFRNGQLHMRRSVFAEAAVGIAVLALAAGMVAQAPRPALPSEPYNASLTAAGVIAAVTISPGSVGRNDVHIIVTPPGASIKPVAGISARVLLPSGQIPESPVTLTLTAQNHWVGSVTFPKAGTWTLEVIVDVTSSNTVLLKGSVPIP